MVDANSDTDGAFRADPWEKEIELARREVLRSMERDKSKFQTDSLNGEIHNSPRFSRTLASKKHHHKAHASKPRRRKLVKNTHKGLRSFKRRWATFVLRSSHNKSYR